MADVIDRQVVEGAAAHDDAVAGFPVLLAGEARLTNPTSVGDGDAVRLQADDQGKLVTRPHGTRDQTVHQRTAITSSTSETTILTQAASVFHDVTRIILSNSSSTLCRVDIRDDTGGTIRLSIALAANGGGAVLSFDPPLTASAVNDNWTAQCSASVDSVYITVLAVKNV